MSQPKETFPYDRERREREFERKGVALVLVYTDPKINASSVYVVEHKENLAKGIREGDIGLPCESPNPGEIFQETINRLFTEEVGITPKDINVNIQNEQEYLRIHYLNRGIQADLVVIRVSNIEQFQGAQPKDTREINRGFFLSLNQLLEDPNIQLRQDLNPRWFLEPLVQEGILKILK